jgi:hypothetical protein
MIRHLPTSAQLCRCPTLSCRLGSTSTSTTATTTTTTVTANTHLEALLEKVQKLEALGHGAQIEDLSASLTEFVAEYEAEKVGNAAREAAHGDRLVGDLVLYSFAYGMQHHARPPCMHTVECC